MNCNHILIVAGEPNSIFNEIFFKAIKKINIKKPIILITSKKIIELQMRYLNLNLKIRNLNYKKLSSYDLDNKSINLINVDYHQNKPFKKISSKSNEFIKNCFKLAFKIIKKEKITRFINGPISKKFFLEKKYLGITEYISENFKKNNTSMLIYNNILSVSPITTHLPIKLISKKITENNIKNKIQLINKFYKKVHNKKPKLGILGINPHCESILKFNEDEMIIKPLVKKMRKNGYKIDGPIPADTAFLKRNRKNYDVIIGMYHDQVLTPIKTIFEYDAINITLGLPFIRISPDHGPNEKMMGQNKSNPLSLIQAMKFLDKN